MKKAQEKKLDVFGTAKVGEIAKKVQESRLKWHGHCINNEKRRRICERESDGDGGAGEKKEKTIEAEVAAGRLVGERTVRRSSASVS